MTRSNRHILKQVRSVATSLFMLLTFGTSSAFAEFFNFAFTGSGGGSITGTFQVIAGGNGTTFPYTITGITNGLVSGFADGNGAITGLLGPGNFGFNDNWFSNSEPYLSNAGVSFSTAAGDWNLYSLGGGSYRAVNNLLLETVQTGTMAEPVLLPEIDGASLPKAVLFLGALYLLTRGNRRRKDKDATAPDANAL